MINPIKRALRRLRFPTIMPSIRDEELAYLGDATSIVDLEMREREISGGRFHRQGFLG